MKQMNFKMIAVAILLLMNGIGVNQVQAQTDFYSLSRKEKEARAEELIKMDFDTMLLDTKTMQAYNTELKRFGMYYDKKHDKELNYEVWGLVGGGIGACLGAGICVLSLPVGLVICAGSIYFLVDAIVRTSQGRLEKYADRAQTFKAKANDVIPDFSN